MKNKLWHFNKSILLFCGLLLVTIIFMVQNTHRIEAKDQVSKAYMVKATTKPKNIKYTKYSTYNKNTRQYYMLRSYLEQLEKDGGGTLILKKGTYNISNTLYVPSHVTINFEDGVIMKKTDQTGISSLASSKSIFQLIAPSKSMLKGVYGGYGGETDIKFLGKGTVIIDLNFMQDVVGIIMAHNMDIHISGIIFQNMKGGHFIELDASKDVIIDNNRFIHHKTSKTGIKEAVNIDTPDQNTEGLHVIWTNYDCTPNKDILIRENYFDDLERAIGTHKYSEGKYHENVQILKNEISNIDSDAIRILNWSNPYIKENKIQMVNGNSGGKRAILASGVINPTIMENTFIKVPRAIQIMPWKNTGPGSLYAITYNDIRSENITWMLMNELIDVGERFIRINKQYNIYDSATDKYYW